MSEQKDPAIKLFGMTIPVAEPPPIYAGGGGGCSLEASSSSTTTALVEENINMNMNSKNISCGNMDRDEGDSNKDGEEDEREVQDQDQGDDNDKEMKEEPQPEVSSEEPRNSDAASGVSSNLKTSSLEENSGTPKPDEEQSEGTNSQEKTTLKKPDKILPCPRCNSMDTKFCYYNNYNVNQPRHFCKNCQRYWTAGGTMRNVPVGAGRRKNKNSSSSASAAVAVQYRHVTEAALTPKPNGTVLSFGSDTPLCESMASVLSLGDRTMRNGFHKPEDLTIPIAGEETSPPAEDEPPQDQQAVPSFVPPIPCFPAGTPWPYQWSPQAAAFCPPGFPMPFYPAAAAYWGWNVPWLPPQPPISGSGGPSSGPNSPTLGKHSRDENTTASRPSSWEGEPAPMQREGGSERSLWIPKTLRIDDPGEAARSSIWATLGIKKDKPDSISGTGLFKSFQSKNDQRNPIQETSTKLLQANPAALSRSVSFQERS